MADSREKAPGPSIGRSELAAKVYWTAPGMTRADARVLVDQVLQEIIEGLADDGKVMLTGFGHFAVNLKAQRNGRNPKTGQEFPIAARRVVSFRASSQLKRSVAASVSRPSGDASGAAYATMKKNARSARHSDKP